MVLLVCVVLSTHDWFMVSQGLKKKKKTHTHLQNQHWGPCTDIWAHWSSEWTGI